MKYTANFNLRKPDYTDVANIADINANMDAIDIELQNTYKARANVALEYSPTVLYHKGDMCTYDMELYMCNESQAAAGDWDSTKWDRVTIDTVVVPLLQTVGLLKSFIAGEYDSELSYAKDDLVWRDNKLYRCIVDTPNATAWVPTEWEEVIFSNVVKGALGNGT